MTSVSKGHFESESPISLLLTHKKVRTSKDLQLYQCVTLMRSDLFLDLLHTIFALLLTSIKYFKTIALSFGMTTLKALFRNFLRDSQMSLYFYTQIVPFYFFHFDALDKMMGAVLSQLGKYQLEHPIVQFCRTF